MRSIKPLKFTVHGLDCAEEVAVLKRDVGPVVGGEDLLSFDLLNTRMTVLAGPRPVFPDEVIRAVARTGMRAEPWVEGTPQSVATGYWERRGRTVLTVASGILTLTGYAIHAGVTGDPLLPFTGEGAVRATPLAARLVYSLACLTGAWSVLPKAWAALRRGRPDMNLLMVVAVLGAAAIGDWLEAATVAFLFALSLALEGWSVGRARRAVAALLELVPAQARVRRDGRDQLVPADAVTPGTVFVVRPGEKVPLDGTVVGGTSELNQAPITGESVPVPKRAGDTVYAGTINGDGGLEVACTKAAGDTTLAHIVRLVRDAQAKRSPSEQWVDKFARVYTPAVIALALAVLLVPPVLFHAPWLDWMYRALVLLVIACPCALVISTPVSVVAALAAAARNGVLIKGGAFVEAPAHLKAIAFDKTGTLTEGRPRVVEVVPLNGHDERELLERAASLEAGSTHPLARAVVAHAHEKGVTPAVVADVQAVQGKGVKATFNGKGYWLGSHRYLEERNQETPEVHERLEALTNAGRTVVVVGNDEHVCGFLALVDTVRPGVREVLATLKGLGVERLVMLTGDNRGTADAIAREAGVDEARSELLPADKVQAVADLVTRYGATAMVGDGVNDAPALGRATVGIAMGAVGTDAAIETADIALMTDDLAKLPWLIGHSRRTLAVIRQNIAFSLAVKAVFVVLTLVGISSMWAAVAADSGATLLVVFNALRLTRIRND